VYIIATQNKSQEDFRKRSREFFRKMRFTNENAGEKLLREFSAGHGFLVDPVAIQVSLCPLRPMFAGVFPLKIGDCMGELVNERI
jgi:hypothetical protein